MNNRTHHIGTLRILDRLPSSKYGNPRYLLEVDGYVCRTAPDSSLAYSLPNHDGTRVSAIIGTHYGKRTIESVTAAPEREIKTKPCVRCGGRAYLSNGEDCRACDGRGSVLA